MNITLDYLNYLISSSNLKNSGLISENESIEFFDSIDCLDIDELVSLYAIVSVGGSENTSLHKAYLKKGYEVGYELVNLLVNDNNLGKNLIIGINLLEIE